MQIFAIITFGYVDHVFLKNDIINDLVGSTMSKTRRTDKKVLEAIGILLVIIS